MGELIEAIPVRDSSGDELMVYEYRDFVPHLTFLGLSRGEGHQRFALDTGEVVVRMDDDTFVVAATGERLSRIS